MPTPSSPLERANGILRAFSAPFRLRKHRRSRWVTVYEILPDRRTRERSLPGCGAVDPEAIDALCERLLAAAKQGLTLEAVIGTEASTPRRSAAPCWPEICDAVVAFQRGQGVNMNLVGPFKGQGYFRLLPHERPASLEDVRRFALHTSESLKTQLMDPNEPLLPMATHRQGFRQKREVVSLLRRAGSPSARKDDASPSRPFQPPGGLMESDRCVVTARPSRLMSAGGWGLPIARAWLRSPKSWGST